jgi:anthranilate/para-aminobenzoate synthase component II
LVFRWFLIQTDDSYTYTFITDRAININALIKNNSYPNLDLETYKVLVEPILPELVIINPGSVCFPNTVNITGAEITQGSTAG